MSRPSRASTSTARCDHFETRCDLVDSPWFPHASSTFVHVRHLIRGVQLALMIVVE